MLALNSRQLSEELIVAKKPALKGKSKRLPKDVLDKKVTQLNNPKISTAEQFSILSELKNSNRIVVKVQVADINGAKTLIVDGAMSKSYPYFSSEGYASYPPIFAQDSLNLHPRFIVTTLWMVKLESSKGIYKEVEPSGG